MKKLIIASKRTRRVNHICSLWTGKSRTASISTQMKIARKKPNNSMSSMVKNSAQQPASSTIPAIPTAKLSQCPRPSMPTTNFILLPFSRSVIFLLAPNLHSITTPSGMERPQSTPALSSVFVERQIAVVSYGLMLERRDLATMPPRTKSPSSRNDHQRKIP